MRDEKSGRRTRAGRNAAPVGRGKNDSGDGVQAAGRRGRPVRWTPEYIESELRAFLGGRQTWPRRDEFRAALRGELLAAVTAHGGAEYWAGRVGVTLGPRQHRRLLDAEQARQEAEEVIAELGYLPGPAKLRARGHGRLASFLDKRGGTRRFLIAIGRPDAQPPSN